MKRFSVYNWKIVVINEIEHFYCFLEEKNDFNQLEAINGVRSLHTRSKIVLWKRLTSKRSLAIKIVFFPLTIQYSSIQIIQRCSFLVSIFELLNAQSKSDTNRFCLVSGRQFCFSEYKNERQGKYIAFIFHFFSKYFLSFSFCSLFDSRCLTMCKIQS